MIKFCGNCGAELEENAKVCGKCGAPVTGISASSSKLDFTQQKKKGNKNKVIAIVIVLVVVIIAILGLKIALDLFGDDNVYAYLSAGKYELLTSLEKEQAIEIASSKSGNEDSSWLLAFSPDEKYIYYYTKYDSNVGTASLCRAEYGKLKENSAKNDKYIEIIATNVKLGFRFLDDGSVTYQTGEGTLYYFDGKTTAQVAKNVASYYTDGSERLVYYSGEGYTGYTLYGVILSDIDNRVKLASNLFAIVNAMDFNNILYSKRETDDSKTLYVTGFEREEEKLAERVSNLTYVGEKTYFTAENGRTLDLYNFVEDDYADSDAGMAEPDIEDFAIPIYHYVRIEEDDLSESWYEELYTSCNHDLYWYGDGFLWRTLYSMEEAVNRKWGDNTDAIHAATQNFIDKFADSADEDGYIFVTDEVKEALQEIQKYAANPEKKWQWLWLCYWRYPDGTTTDYDAYDAACDKWYEVRDRIELREALQDKGNAQAVCTLYCFEQGTLTAVDENVLNAIAYDGAMVFNTLDSVTEKVKLENISSIRDVQTLFDLNRWVENYAVLFQDGTTCRMSDDATETLEEVGNIYAERHLYFTDKEVYLNENNGALSIAPIDDGVVGDFTIITDDAKVVSLDGDTLYYANELHTNNDYIYFDLYSYSNGNSNCLARDVISNTINLYEDGIILAYTDYKSKLGYELTMIDSEGESTFIADGVTQYLRVDSSTLLYISDRDLYFYNGKEKKLVKRGVDRFWSLNAMEILKAFGWNNYARQL